MNHQHGWSYNNALLPHNLPCYLENEEHHQCGLGKISIFNKENSALCSSIGHEIINWFI